MSAELNYHNTTFLISAPDIQHCPQTRCEVAFAGRSNAGKSSALNTLTGSARLARTSKTPGRTQLLNYFEVSPGVCLVDLPGYGYASVPEAVRRSWQKRMYAYLEQRTALAGLILISDIRHALKPSDVELLRHTAARSLPVHILLSKADKLKRGPALNVLTRVRKELGSHPGEVSLQLFSSLKKQGREELEARLNTWLVREGEDR